MSHIVAKEAYKSLEERLNKLPQGAPPSETLYKILEMLYTKREAELVAKLPIRPFTLKTASYIWKTSEKESEIILEELAKRALILDSEKDGVKYFVLPPPMAGFMEFALMRTRGDIDQRLLSELYHQYLFVEEDFVRELFWSTETKLGRAFVQEPALDMSRNDDTLHILDYEKATHIIENSIEIGLSMCYCRHKNHHLGTACDAPMETCMTFNDTAKSLIKNSYARKIDVVEAKEVLHRAYEANLVQCGENARNMPSFMCNCCSCCCEAFVAARKLGMLHPVETTNFIAIINNESCVKCGRCVKACPIDAIEIVEDKENNTKRIELNKEACIGCGVCLRNCKIGSITLKARDKRVITPVNSVHRIASMAIEKGQLQNLIFDNEALKSHRAMKAILGAILKMPPIKRAMASKQLKSVYLEKLLEKSKI